MWASFDVSSLPSVPAALWKVPSLHISDSKVNAYLPFFVVHLDFALNSVWPSLSPRICPSWPLARNAALLLPPLRSDVRPRIRPSIGPSVRRKMTRNLVGFCRAASFLPFFLPSFLPFFNAFQLSVRPRPSPRPLCVPSSQCAHLRTQSGNSVVHSGHFSTFRPALCLIELGTELQ